MMRGTVLVYSVYRVADDTFLTNATRGTFGRRWRVFKSKSYALWLAKKYKARVQAYSLYWVGQIDEMC